MLDFVEFAFVNWRNWNIFEIIRRENMIGPPIFVSCLSDLSVGGRGPSSSIYLQQKIANPISEAPNIALRTA